MTHATQRGLAGAVAAAVLAIAANLAFAQPPGAAPPGLPPLFFKEEWQQRALPPNAPPFPLSFSPRGAQRLFPSELLPHRL